MEMLSGIFWRVDPPPPSLHSIVCVWPPPGKHAHLFYFIVPLWIWKNVKWVLRWVKQEVSKREGHSLQAVDVGIVHDWFIFQLAGQDQAARKVKSKLIVLTYVCLLGFSERAVQVGHPDTVSSEREIFTYLYRSLQGREIRTYFYQLRVREKFLHTSTSGHRVNLPPPPHPQRPTILSGLAGSNGEGGGDSNISGDMWSWPQNLPANHQCGGGGCQHVLVEQNRHKQFRFQERERDLYIFLPASCENEICTHLCQLLVR